MNRFNSVILSQVRFCFQTADCCDSPYFSEIEDTYDNISFVIVNGGLYSPTKTPPEFPLSCTLSCTLFAYFLLQDRFRLLQCCQNPHCIVVIFLSDHDFIQCFICSEIPTHAADGSPARGCHFSSWLTLFVLYLIFSESKALQYCSYLSLDAPR